MIPRHQLPARSPVDARALAAGLAAALRPGAPRHVPGLLQREYGARDVLATGSGTCALSLALRAAVEMRGGGPVALPAYGCYDLATAADGAGVRVALYDVDPTTLLPDEDSLRRALEREPSAVVVVHLYGVPVDVPRVAAMAASAGAVLVEDAAQGSGTRVGECPAGAAGSVGVLSFGRGKGVTGGGGGALLANDGAGVSVVSRARSMVEGSSAGWRQLAGAAGQWVLARPWLYGLPASLRFLRLGETIYHPPAPTAPLSAAADGMLSVTWPLSRTEAGVRKANAARLLRSIENAPDLTAVSVAAQGTPGYLRLPVLAGTEARARAEAPEARRLGIMPGYPTALCDLEGFRRRLVNADDDFSGARLLAERLVTLPVHGLLSEGDLRRLEEWIERQGPRQMPVSASPEPEVRAGRIRGWTTQPGVYRRETYR